ncbi:hypothetical protein BH11BAC6_BH11BAC6_12710 [soil metagenome]
MSQYIVTAPKLNKRSQVPASLPDNNHIVGAVLKDFVFDGEEVIAVPNPAMGKWYRDRDGYYYWGGALTTVQPIAAPALPEAEANAATNLTEAQLKAATGSFTVYAQKFLPFVKDTCSFYKINTGVRMLCFLAQVGHESGGLYYTAELADGHAYEGRKDLGNTHPGDGTKYKGRGLIQITGRANYQQLSHDFDQDFINKPEMLGGKNAKVCTDDQLKFASQSAGWFWDKHALNAIADKMDLHQSVDEGNNLIHFKEITRKINGGYNGLGDRLVRYEKGLELFV